MRRCGSVFCLAGAGFLLSTLIAGGALAAGGGNGAAGGNAGHAGKGLALAKGHVKHAPPAPQPPSAPVKPARSKSATGSASIQAAPPVSPRTERRSEHRTICHRTGSGRYIVISPSLRGASTGHLRKHDDFVYTGRCERAPETPPTPPDPPPAPGGNPGSVRPNLPEAGPAQASPRGELPFTGVPAFLLMLSGGGLIAAGYALTRRPR